MSNINRSTFLAGTAAVLGAAMPRAAESAGPAAPVTSTVPPDRLLGRLMAGNKRFLDNDFPDVSRAAEKRELLIESQAPFAAILSCSDSRVIPNLIFVQGIGDLFVARVAGNYPDDLVLASIEYAVKHLGTRLIMVLGHQGCGAVQAVYEAIQTKTPLPPPLSTIERLIAPGITGVVAARGGTKEAEQVNARAGVSALKAGSAGLTKGNESGELLLVAAYYHFGTGEVTLLE
jgi:carbonic anhydrase